MVTSATSTHFCTDGVVEWRAVVGYEGLYVVSSTGLVKSLRRNKLLALSGDPYLHIALSANGIREDANVHILVARAFLGVRSAYWEVNHKNGVKKDNSPGNLEWVTRARNSQHARELGLQGLNEGNFSSETTQGAKNHAAILNETQVLEIRRRYKNSDHSWKSRLELAKEFGIVEGQLQSIVYRNSWRHI